jgi:5-methylcytosine-specific restriction endonuclease McrA
MNLCEKCGKEFIPYKRRPNQKYCCENCGNAALQKKYRSIYRDKYIETDRNYRANHLEEEKINHRNYYLSHKDQCIARAKKWHLEHPEKGATYHRKWFLSHPDTRHLPVIAYRARKAKASGRGVSKDDWIEILNRYNNKCLACGSTEDITMDHIIPLVKGGAHDPDNIQPLCKSCNCKKLTKIIDYR